MRFFLVIAALIVASIATWQIAESPTVSPDGDVVPPLSEHTLVPNAGGTVSVYNGIDVSLRATTLDLSGRGLTGSLKAEVRQLSQLETLDLSNNAFTGLPAEVGQLSHLRVLDLSNNQFTGLPQELGNLQSLTLLDLTGNNISETDVNIITAALPDTTEVRR